MIKYIRTIVFTVFISALLASCDENLPERPKKHEIPENAPSFISENFTNASTPAGWTYSNFSRISSGGINNSACLRASLSGNYPITASVTIPYVTLSANNPRVVFNYRATTGSSSNATATADGALTYSVSVSTNGSTWEDISGATNIHHVSSADFATISANLSAFANQTVMTRITFTGQGSGSLYVYLDDISVYGSVDAKSPALTTDAVTVFSSTTAMLGGNIIDAGIPEYTERGVCYYTSSNPTTANSRLVASGTGTGIFSVNAIGLVQGVRYYVRAYAINASGTVYGNEVSFVPTHTSGSTFTETFELSLGGALLAGWVFVNGDRPNKWHVGTATAHDGSSGACYISNNNSANTYSTGSGSGSIVHLYRDFHINSTAESPAKISFYWKGNGRSGSDFLSVHLVETSVIPTVGTALPTPLVQLSGSATWQEEELILPVLSGQRRLVFTWRNTTGANSSAQPPAAIDNITVTNTI